MFDWFMPDSFAVARTFYGVPLVLVLIFVTRRILNPETGKLLDKTPSGVGCLLFALGVVLYGGALLLLSELLRRPDPYETVGWFVTISSLFGFVSVFTGWGIKRYRPDNDRLAGQLATAGKIILGGAVVWFLAELRVNNWNTADDLASQTTAAAIRDVSEGKPYPFLSLHDKKLEDLKTLLTRNLPTECLAPPLQIERARYAPRIRFVASETYSDAKTEDGNAHAVLLLNSGDCWSVVYGGVAVSDEDKTVLSHFHVFGHARSKKQAILQTHKQWYHVPWRIDSRIYDVKRWVRRDEKNTAKTTPE